MICRAITLILLVLSIGCMRKESPAPNFPPQENLSLLSVWGSNDRVTILDLSAATLGTQGDLQFIHQGNNCCKCKVTITGDQASGTMAVSNCSLLAGTGTAPNCSAHQTNYTYNRVSFDTIELCPSGTRNNCPLYTFQGATIDSPLEPSPTPKK